MAQSHGTSVLYCTGGKANHVGLVSIHPVRTASPSHVRKGISTLDEPRPDRQQRLPGAKGSDAASTGEQAADPTPPAQGLSV